MPEKTALDNEHKKKKKDVLSFKITKKGKRVLPLLSVLRVICLPIIALIKPFRFYGNRKVKDGACVYIGNHYAMLDIAFPFCTTWEGIHYVCKRSLVETPFVGWFVRKAKAIPVSRDGNDVRALLDCFKCLKNGEKVALYPEGTRNKTDAEMLPFKHGASVMAIRTKTPIIPIMLYNKPRFFRMTHVLIGDPIELTEYYDRKLTDEDYAEADEKLRQLLLQMRADHKTYLESKKRKR